MRTEGREAILLSDGLAPNAETIQGRFPVEPLNAVTSLAFLVVAIYWARRTRMKLSRHPLVVMSVPVLFVGALGGMAHHAFRGFRDIRHLDMLMAFYGVAMACVFFWHKVTKSWVMSFSMTLLFPVAFRYALPDSHVIGSASVVFAALSLSLLPPVAIRCWMDGMRRVSYLLASSAFFLVGMFFRELDSLHDLVAPVGTHCLWHVFGALSVCAVLGYAYELEEDASAGRE
jgi:hemolysin III